MQNPDRPRMLGVKSYEEEFSQLDLSTLSKMIYEEGLLAKDADPGLGFYHFASFDELKIFQDNLVEKIQDFNSRHGSVDQKLKKYFKDGAWRVRVIENEKMIIKEIRYRLVQDACGRVSLVIYSEQDMKQHQ